MARPTLEDIAKIAGVSRATVSRVVNNHPNIRESVRERVQQVIDEVGYHPNIAARSLVTQQSGIIGLVIPRNIATFFSDPYFPRLTEGIARACNQYDYTLSLFLLATEEDERKLFPRISQSSLVDGIIVQATHLGDELLPKLSEGNVPFLVAGRPVNVEDASYIDVDNVAGAQNAVAYLIRLGYRRIATITGALNSSAGKDRLQGYREALSERGLSIDSDLIIEGDFTETGGYFAAKQLLNQRPDAIFVGSDTMALGVSRALQEEGVRIPEDIALVGYDDLPPAQLITPQLTTVRQPIQRFGFQAVELLLDIIQNGTHPPRRVILGTELIIRDSCCEPQYGPARSTP